MPEPRTLQIDLSLDLIKIDDNIQPRERLEEGPLAHFRELYKEYGSEALPAIVVYHDADDIFWLADGHYRYFAARDALSSDGPRTLPAIVYEGTQREAFFYAAGANKHGTHLTNAEKRRVVERLLQDPVWGEWSSRDLARHVGVSNSFVSGIRNELEAQAASVSGEQMVPYRTVKARRGGKDYPMNVENIRERRGAKAKTAATTTEPASPAVSQDVPEADKDDERNTAVDQEIVEDDTAMGIADAKDFRGSDSDDDYGVTPKGFVALIDAWFRATAEERQHFLAWAHHRKIDEPAGITTPEAHARYYLVGNEALQMVAAALSAKR